MPSFFQISLLLLLNVWVKSDICLKYFLDKNPKKAAIVICMNNTQTDAKEWSMNHYFSHPIKVKLVILDKSKVEQTNAWCQWWSPKILSYVCTVTLKNTNI